MRIRLPGPAAAALGAALLLALYLCVSLVLPGPADVRRYSSGILDMDVSRVVADVTSARPAYRGSVHPLQKLLLTPLGSLSNHALFGGRDPLAAVKVLIALFTTANALACGLLAKRLAGGSAPAAVAAGLLTAVSFSSLLAASIPESAAFASVAAVLPLLLLAARWERPLGAREACAWAGLGLIGIGLTLTQVVHAAIAFAVRLVVSPGGRRGQSRLGPAALALALAVVAVAGAAKLQTRLYPGTRAFSTLDPLASERPWLRTDALRETPLLQVGRLAAHFAVLDFAPPSPTYSDFLLRDGLDYWALSIEEVPPADWGPTRLALGALVLAAGALAARRDPRLLAPALCIASQFGLHLLYGREYVLYSPHWHGVLVAVLVAGAWNALGRRGRLVPAAAALLSALILANNLAVMRGIYREVAFGLDAARRDEEGRLRFRRLTPNSPPARPPPGRSLPPGASGGRP